MQDLLEGLNDKQYEAVINTDGPCLVIAGAGSGKTKVLTHKIAYLMQEKDIKPWNILAITFTNKASNEMKERVEALVGDDAKDMWIGTFHSICVKILRRFIDRIGFDHSFVIFDTSDQRTLIKECLKDLQIDDKMFTDRIVQFEISNAKNDMKEPEEYEAMAKGDYRKEKIASVYNLYQKRLKENNAIDFDDIINYVIKIFKENDDVLDYYTNKFNYILVDEYQDTNKAQFTLIRLLAKAHGNITVVGDNDQCLVGDTKIQTSDGIKLIKDIKKGDKVLSASGKGNINEGIVESTKQKEYEGKIIKIITKKGFILQGTPNHIIFSKLIPDQDNYYVYLMYKKDLGYRIGQTSGVRKNDVGDIQNGLCVRMRQEKADKIWLLKTCKNLQQARYYESYYAFTYGIPTLVFHSQGRAMQWTQKNINKLFNSIDTETRVEKLMQDLELSKEYEENDRGMRIIELDESYQMCTSQNTYEYLIRIAKQPKKYVLTDVLLETLSIIAYKQPVTKAEIEKIRGVSCDHAVSKLVEYNLVSELGRLDAPGRPMLFGTTEEFLRSFGIHSLEELPEMSSVQLEEFKQEAEAEVQI